LGRLAFGRRRWPAIRRVTLPAVGSRTERGSTLHDRFLPRAAAVRAAYSEQDTREFSPCGFDHLHSAQRSRYGVPRRGWRPTALFRLGERNRRWWCLARFTQRRLWTRSTPLLHPRDMRRCRRCLPACVATATLGTGLGSSNAGYHARDCIADAMIRKPPFRRTRGKPVWLSTNPTKHPSCDLGRWTIHRDGAPSTASPCVHEAETSMPRRRDAST